VVLAAHPSLGVKSLAELIALAKAKPGIPYATSGAGSQQAHCCGMVREPCRDQAHPRAVQGRRQAISDFIAGQVPLASLGSSPLITHYKAGKITLARTEHPYTRADITHCADLRGGGASRGSFLNSG